MNEKGGNMKKRIIIVVVLFIILGIAGVLVYNIYGYNTYFLGTVCNVKGYNRAEQVEHKLYRNVVSGNEHLDLLVYAYDMDGLGLTNEISTMIKIPFTEKHRDFIEKTLRIPFESVYWSYNSARAFDLYKGLQGINPIWGKSEKMPISYFIVKRDNEEKKYRAYTVITLPREWNGRIWHWWTFFNEMYKRQLPQQCE